MPAANLLAAGNADAMARLLRSQIEAPGCITAPWGDSSCMSHLAFVDEIDYRFAENAPNLNTRAWAGRTSRNQAKRKFPNYIPRPLPGHAGNELSAAMAQLAAIPYPDGGTYADRVHFYIAPGVVSSIGVGKGKYQNLGRDRRPHFRSHEGLRGALQLAGGVWLEMYHFDQATKTRRPFNTSEWAAYPWRFAPLHDRTRFDHGRPGRARQAPLPHEQRDAQEQGWRTRRVLQPGDTAGLPVRTGLQRRQHPDPRERRRRVPDGGQRG